MKENAKLNRIIAFIIILLGPRNYTRSELEERFEISKSTFHRYIRLLRNNGILVDQHDGYYQILKIEPELKSLSELLHFSEEEAQILNNAILAIDDNNQLKTNLIKKLYSIYDFDRIPETISRPAQAKNIQSIIKAIKEQKQIQLINYQSAHSQHSENRLVEAFDFTFNYQMIWAYEPKSHQNKQFKVSRIKEVKILNKKWQHTKQHFQQPNDDFRMTGTKAEICKLKMSLRAGNLMIEEYPKSEMHLRLLDNDTYEYKGEIRDYHGVGRFCLGLLNEIKIIEPIGLKQYIDQCVKKYQENNLGVFN
jgi:predicted DNA-binding transcriptional regulator YafY